MPQSKERESARKKRCYAAAAAEEGREVKIYSKEVKKDPRFTKDGKPLFLVDENGEPQQPDEMTCQNVEEEGAGEESAGEKGAEEPRRRRMRRSDPELSMAEKWYGGLTRAGVTLCPPLPDGCEYIENFWDEPGLQANLDAVPMRMYGLRTGPLRRAPKFEWYYAEDGAEQKVYRWGQWSYEHLRAEKMPGWLLQLRGKIVERFAESPNHAIMIRYSDGNLHHAPDHKDKQAGNGEAGGAGDMVAGTSFFVYSYGEPRIFHFTDDEGRVVWQKALAKGSLLHVSAGANARYKHGLPQQPGHNGVRDSLIFRTVDGPLENVLIEEPNSRFGKRLLWSTERHHDGDASALLDRIREVMGPKPPTLREQTEAILVREDLSAEERAEQAVALFKAWAAKKQ